MKKEVHPKQNKVKVQCISCGTGIDIFSTVSDIKIDICSNCHPFYSGKASSDSKRGRIEKFNQKFNIKKNK